MPTNWKNWLTFGGDLVPDTDSRSLFPLSSLLWNRWILGHLLAFRISCQPIFTILQMTDADKVPGSIISIGHIWDVMLVWRKGNINKTVSVLQYCVLLLWCTKARAILTGRSTGSGFDLAWFSSLIFQAPLCLQSWWCYIHSNFFLLHLFLYLLVSWAW